MSQERLSRSNRRKLERANKKAAITSTGFQTVRIAGFETILEHEGELGFLESQKAEYNGALTYDRNLLRVFNSLRDLGLDEESLRRMYFDPPGKNPILPDEFNQLDMTKLNVLKRIGSTVAVIARNKKDYRDEDDDEIDKLLTSGIDVSVIDLLRDKTFRMSENVALLSMQIDWLRERRRKERKAKMRSTKKLQVSTQAISEKAGEEIITEVDSEVILDSIDNEGEKDPFYDDTLMLGGRQLFWTDRFFSIDASHLTPLNSHSRTSAIEQISQLGRGQISVKPQSIVSAVEFHLRRDVIQRALGMRNKYGPEGIRDWVKIKRGRDRIFLNMSSDDETVVFAAGRGYCL